eukprot:TRINITY_DN28544_c0_g2_i1.p1 TRINITY_DN28544_c0_g2~~TRINITY_DN28544_c0_g2_i1.p1  ORF type:complete len:114 (-),score=9.39 TRINITY_DN28544_c0_g2_i1:282-623(-)
MWDLEICKRDAKWSMAVALRSKGMRGEEKKMKKWKKLEKVGFLGVLNNLGQYFGKYQPRYRKTQYDQNLGRYGLRFWRFFPYDTDTGIAGPYRSSIGRLSILESPYEIVMITK